MNYMLNVKMINPHSKNNRDCFLLTEGKSFKIVLNNKSTLPFSEADSEALIKGLTCIETRKVIESLKINRPIPESNKVLIIPCELSNLQDEYQFMVLDISHEPFSVWNVRVLTDYDVINLPNGCLDDIISYLKSTGIEPAYTYGKYDRIEFVSKLPEIKSVVTNTVYVLTKDTEEKKANSNWLFTGKRFEAFSEEPVEPNPEDPDTIPDTVVKEPVKGSVGDTSSANTEVWNKAISEKTTVQATESVSIVNSTLTDGSIAVTIA